MDSTLGATELFAGSAVSLLLGWLLYQWILFNFRGYPRGPIGLPLVGYLGVLSSEPHRVLAELSKRYGKLFSLYFGTEYTVVISDYEIAKEVLSHPAALSRPEDVFGFIPNRGGFGGFNGAEWQEQRRFCVFTMRSLGMGKGQWENLTKEHVADFMEDLSKSQGKPMDCSENLILSLSSNNIALLIGRRLPKMSDNEIKFIKRIHSVLSKNFGSIALTALAPWLPKYLKSFRIGGYLKENEELNEFANMFRKEIDHHMKSKDAEDSQDFIGCYLKEMNKQNAVDKSHYFSVDNLVGHLIVLFFAGGDTTISSINWLLLLLASYPNIQQKIYDEIDAVVGRGVRVMWDDRKRLPFTMATIIEMERYVTINRLYPPRVAEKTFECCGYTIPKGSRIIVNSWAVMHDPKYWEKPMEFIPERFIREDGKDPVKSIGLSAFSFGKRNCPGETVALMTIFTYITAIIQNFKVKTPSGGMADLSSGQAGAVTNPLAQELCFLER